MNTVTIAVDLAKNVFELAVSSNGRITESRRLTRTQFERFWILRPPCRVVMEACASAHFWGRQLRNRGFDVALLPARYVRPYRRRNKTDRADCEALLEAARCGGIHPVAIKSEEQQSLLALHRMRAQWMATRTARINSMRALLHEFGITALGGPKRFLGALHMIVDTHKQRLPLRVRSALHALHAEVKVLECNIKELEADLALIAEQEPTIQQMIRIPGVGLLTATAIFASVTDIHAFRNGRCFACWLGLTPREFSSGSTRRIGRISKQGDSYLRTLLVHGARAALLSARRAQAARKPTTQLQTWALQRSSLQHQNQAVVALANKLARIIWAVWYHDRSFDGNFAGAA